ncbi:MAG: hypothetical protein AB1756_01300 [Acidobacteriota bacterium]
MVECPGKARRICHARIRRVVIRLSPFHSQELNDTSVLQKISSQKPIAGDALKVRIFYIEPVPEFF